MSVEVAPLRQTAARVYNLHKWATYKDPYAAPETGLCLTGYRDPEPDPAGVDRKILTSLVVDVRGRRVKTASGSTYILQTPDPDFVKWCRENGVHDPTTDPENPIKDRR